MVTSRVTTIAGVPMPNENTTTIELTEPTVAQLVDWLRVTVPEPPESSEPERRPRRAVKFYRVNRKRDDVYVGSYKVLGDCIISPSQKLNKWSGRDTYAFERYCYEQGWRIFDVSEE